MLKITQLSLPAILLAAGPALAMSDGLAALDTSGDGMLGLEELQVAFPELTGDAFLTMDSNGDGLLDVDEATAAEAAGLLPAMEG